MAQLDPQRGYGDLTFAEVVAGVQDGRFSISPGARLPVLRDTATGRALKGSGQPVQTGVSVQQAALRDFRERAVDDLEAAYEELRAGMKSGDPRFHKIYFESLFGKVGEARGGDGMAETFKLFIQAMQTPETRTITLEGEVTR